MEVKEKSKKRELIKSIAIIFLAVLLVLTFFSNTFMNRSLPEVATQMITSGTINAKIRGSGTVSANEAYEVILNQTREIRSVCVKVGDTVQQGDLLFVLGDVESQELKDAMSQLQSLNLDYQEKILNLSRDGTLEDRDLKKLREDLEKAIQQRDQNYVTEADVSYAKGDKAATDNELREIGAVLAELTAIESETSKAQAAVDELTAKIKSLEDEVAEYQSQLNKLNTSGSIDMERQLQDALNAFNIALNKLNSDWNAYKDTYQGLVTAAGESITVTIDSLKDPALQMKLASYLTKEGVEKPDDANYKKQKNAYDVLTGDQNDANEKHQIYERLKKDSELESSGIQDQKNTLIIKINNANSQLMVARPQLQQATYALNQAQVNDKALNDQIKSYEAAKRQLEARQELLNAQVMELEAKKGVYDTAVENVATIQRQLEDKLTGQDIDDQLEDIGLQRMRLQIQKQQELVDKLKEDTIDTEITANVSGTISAINVSAGKENVSGSPMAVIDVVDRGYTIKVPVTTEQSKQVKVGDKADVSNYYWGNNVDATLEAIAPDPAKPGQGKLLIFRVTGDIDAGSTISLSIGQRSANFDTIVPKSALRSDTNGDFVLVITSKSTPLGNRYIATRADVQILAQDDTSAAVTGLSSGDFVLTTSSKPVEAGTQVRMVDEA